MSESDRVFHGLTAAVLFEAAALALFALLVVMFG